MKVSVILTEVLGEKTEQSESGQREESYPGFTSTYNPKQDEYQENHAQENHFKLLKKSEDNIWKAAREKITLPSNGQ